MVRRYTIKLFFISLFFINGLSVFSQKPNYKYAGFSKSDSIRGTLSPERTCFDVSHYKLDIEINISEQSIAGTSTISFIMLQNSDEIQIDLFENMQIDSIVWKKVKLDFRRAYNAVFIGTESMKAGMFYSINVHYHGKPISAKNAPWDGGFVWARDNRDRPWVGVACEGTGASLWWPNKDHLSDEPDSMDIIIWVDDDFECISNGVLIDKSTHENKSKFHWKVSYPINNYNVSLNIGYYVKFKQAYQSPLKEDLLSCNYYVIDYNLDRAKKHFNQVFGVLEAFEHYLGPYPFWNDGYALIETPYLGMEHQSGIAYGNNFMRGYLGGMIPADMDWDYIIVHETGHEWWGNAVSAKDHAEIWIHESFTTYMEALYVEYHFGYEDMIRYLNGQRRHSNRTPIVGPIGVNYGSWVGTDEYFKGSWIIHTFRHMLGDEDFFPLLKSFYNTFKYQTISTRDFLDFVNDFTGKNYEPFFIQYLYHATIPKLMYSLEQRDDGVVMKYKWDNCVADFIMPIQVSVLGHIRKLECSATWDELEIEGISKSDIEIKEELMLIDIKRSRP